VTYGTDRGCHKPAGTGVLCVWQSREQTGRSQR
jgi:hypothetical protein